MPHCTLAPWAMPRRNCKQLFILGGDGAHKGALQLASVGSSKSGVFHMVESWGHAATFQLGLDWKLENSDTPKSSKVQWFIRVFPCFPMKIVMKRDVPHFGGGPNRLMFCWGLEVDRSWMFIGAVLRDKNQTPDQKPRRLSSRLDQHRYRKNQWFST